MRGSRCRSKWACLLLTSYAALMLVALLVVFTLATRRGRQMLGLVDPWYSLIVIAALAFPHRAVGCSP